MNKSSTQSTRGYDVPLVALIKCLQALSSGDHHWLSRPITRIFVSTKGEVSRYVTAGYSNPQLNSMPNHLIYGLPLTSHRTGVEADAQLIVSFDPRSAVPLARGLYRKRDDLIYDQKRDWSRFWDPIAAALARPPTDRLNTDGTSGECDPSCRKTLEGISYLQSLTAQIKWVSYETEYLQNAISG